MPDVLVVAEPEDTLALRVTAALVAALGEPAVALVSPTELLCAASFRHRLCAEAPGSDPQRHLPRDRVTLRDGRTLVSSEIRVVFNRCLRAAVPQFAAATATDREYAQMEAHALLLSWLSAMPGAVLNPPSPRGLAGEAPGRYEGLALAAAVGLPTLDVLASTSVRRFRRERRDAHRVVLRREPGEARRPEIVVEPLPSSSELLGGGPGLFREPTTDQRAIAVVAGDRVVGPVPRDLHPGLGRLAKRLGSPLLEVHLGLSALDGGWRFESATPVVRCAHPDVIDAIATALLLALDRGSPPEPPVDRAALAAEVA